MTVLGSSLMLATLLLATAACSEGAGGEAAGDSSAPKGEGAGRVDAGEAGEAGPIDSDAARTTTDGAGAIDVPAVDTGPCIRKCTGRICGPDGCGGVCGFCVSGQFCAPDGTRCQEFCKPACEGRACGDDGCGGECGSCAEGTLCGLDFLCHAKDCKPSCGAKKCGDDGCGGSCGSCAEGDLCEPSGSCKPGPCKGIPKAGSCDGDILVRCEGKGLSRDKKLRDCAAKGVGKVCGWDPVANAYGCIDKPPCTPVCADASGKSLQCGDDGCGGSCGTCPSGWSCPGHTCVPEDGADCGFLPAQGKCEGSVWIFCNTSKIKKIDCAKYSQQCKWDAAGGRFTCQ